jgi:hypothetical protein
MEILGKETCSCFPEAQVLKGRPFMRFIYLLRVGLRLGIGLLGLLGLLVL